MDTCDKFLRINFSNNYAISYGYFFLYSVQHFNMTCIYNFGTLSYATYMFQRIISKEIILLFSNKHHSNYIFIHYNWDNFNISRSHDSTKLKKCNCSIPKYVVNCRYVRRCRQVLTTFTWSDNTKQKCFLGLVSVCFMSRNIRQVLAVNGTSVIKRSILLKMSNICFIKIQI